MSTLIDNLNYINSCKSDIRSAIEAKGVSMTGVSFPDYATAIGSISGGGASLSKLTVTENGKYYAYEYGYDGFSYVKVEVPQSVGYPLSDLLEGNLSVISDSTITFVRSGAMMNTNVTTVNLPNCTTIYGMAFYECYLLSELILPNCITFPTSAGIGEYCAFGGCLALTTVSLPACISIGNSTFRGCNHLSEVYLPLCENIGPNAFNACTALTSVNLPACITIANSAFNACTALTTLTLGASTVCGLGGSKVFTNTNITSIYVPSSLVSDYRIANHWSSFANKIFAIPE